MRLVKVLSAAIVLSSMLAVPALAATCNPPGGFDAFLAAFKRDAAAKGVSPRGLSALNGITLDPSVLAADKHQGVFKQTFEEFSGRMISRDRMTKGLRLLQVHAPVLRKAEQQFGVPGPVIVAIWGLETDFGASVGKKEVIRSVATLAFDCRRTDMFQAQLTDALRIVDRGDLTPAEMLDRELSRWLRLAARPALERRRSEFRGDQGLEQGHRLRQDHRGVRRAARGRRGAGAAATALIRSD
jgi:membrane-bound lytic murein transglycosylase B